MICYWRCRKIFCKLAHAQCEHSSTEGSLKFVRVWICWEWDIGGIWNWITSNNDLTYLTIKTEMFLNCFCCHIFSSQCSLYNYGTIFVISQSSLQTIFSLIFSRHRHQQTTKQRDARPEKQENIVTKHLIGFFFFFKDLSAKKRCCACVCIVFKVQVQMLMNCCTCRLEELPRWAGQRTNGRMACLHRHCRKFPNWRRS